MDTSTTGIELDNAATSETGFIQEWLECNPSRHSYTKFRCVPLSECQGKRECILESLAKTVFLHHNDPEEFTEIVAALGYEQAAQEFDKRPRDDKTRKGNFGEVVASEYLKQFEGFEIPVYRLRWNSNPDSSMRGEDIVAFKFGDPGGEGREICVAEAKVMGTYRSSKVAEAHEQLTTSRRPRPNSIPFIHTVLKSRGDVEKAAAVLAFQNRFLDPPPVRTNFIMLITGNSPRDPFGVLEESSQVLQNLTVADLWLTDMAALVNALFEFEVDVDNSSGSE